MEQFSKILPHVDFDRAYDLLVRSGPLFIELESSTEEEQEEDELTATRRRVESLEAANKRLRIQNVALARLARRYKRLARVSAPNALSSQAEQLQLVLCRGRGHRYFPMRGGLSMAARRCASGVSARRFGLTLGIKVHHTTVVRWEILLESSIQAAR